MNFQDILERLKDYLAILKKWWFLIVLSVLICGSILWFFAYTSPKLYTAVSVFHPDINQSRGANGIQGNPLSAILSRNGESVETSFMVEILKSRNVTESMTKDTVMVNGDSVLMADLVINSFPERFNLFTWLEELFKGPGKEMSLERKVLSAAGIIRASTNIEITKSGFIKMRYSAFDPELATVASEKLISGLDQYYREQKTEKARQNLTFFTQRADSVKSELDKVNRTIANYYDRNKFGVKTTENIYPREMTMRQDLLREMYITLEINKEQAKAQLQEKTPVIQILDPAKPPYSATKRSSSLYLFVGVFLGFVGAIFLLCYKLLIEDVKRIIKQQIFAANNDPEQNTEPS
ncbi:MAG: hypothetical protein KDD63_17010 [Bacteroidetes bacterium]|nr:hypothetical protein [Bacteroidota bacterium]